MPCVITAIAQQTHSQPSSLGAREDAKTSGQSFANSADSLLALMAKKNDSNASPPKPAIERILWLAASALLSAKASMVLAIAETSHFLISRDLVKRHRDSDQRQLQA